MAVHLWIETHIRERELKRQADKLAKQFDQTGAMAADKFSTSFERGVAQNSPKIQRAFHAIQNAQAAVNKETERYIFLQNTASKSTLAAQVDRIAAARRREADAHRSAATALREFKAVSDDAQTAAEGLADSLQKVGQVAFRSSRGLLAIAAVPAVAFLDDLAHVAVTASQSILLLPAAATAAGAGFLTLKLATAGFGDAIKDIRDPKKFAEDLQLLGPAAQQAALSIQALMPQFDALRKATSDAFFADLGGKGGIIEQLTSKYLPAIQGMTTSIADSFNNMFKQISANLLTPETQTQLQGIMTNISAAFENALPAVNSFMQAFTDITDVGATFLPGLGTGIADAATSFASFIREAKESGKLKEWIQEGIDAVSALAREIGTLAKDVYTFFGQDGPKNIENFKNSMDTIHTSIAFMRGDFKTLFDSIAEDFTKAWSHGDVAKNTMDDILNYGIRQLNSWIDKVNKVSPFKDIPHVEEVTGDRNTSGGAFGPPTSATENRTSGASGAPGPQSPWGPYGDRPVPAAPGGPGASDKERRDAIIAGLDPSLWRVDPHAGIPGGPPMGAPGAGMGGLGVVDPEKVWEQNIDVLRKAHDLEESKKDLLARQRDGVSSAEEINDAQWKVTNDTWDLQKAQQDLAEAQRGTTKNLKDSFGEMGAALDADLGISKGLPGLADNIVRFIGNLAAAPLMGQLNAISAANQAANPNIQGGGGMIGMWGARNIATTGNPLGIPGMNTAQQTTGGPTNPSFGQMALGPTNAATAANAYAGGYPGDAALLAHVPAGRYTQEQRGDLTQGLADCSSAVEDLVNLMQGQPTAGANMYTGNAASWLTQHGLLPTNQPVPGALNVGYNAGHMQATLPGGTPFNWGGAASAAAGGVGGSGAWDPAFTSHYYLPNNGAGAPPPTTTQQSTGGPAAPSLYSPQNTNPALTSASTAASPEIRLMSGSTPLLPPGIPSGPGNVPGQNPLNFPGSGLSTGGIPPGPTPGPFPLPPGAPGNTAGGILPGSPGGPGMGPLGGNPATIGGNYGGAGVIPNVGSPAGGGGFGWGGGANPTPIGGAAPIAPNPGGGGASLTPGGSIDTALGIAASGLDVLAPGAGVAAQIGIKEASRAIQYAGQVAGIGVGGLLETFLPTGGSELANNNWLTRIAGGIAGAAPALPNIAGGAAGQAQMNGQAPVAPGDVASGQGTGPPPGPTITQNITSNATDTDGMARDVDAHTRAAHLGGMASSGIGPR